MREYYTENNQRVPIEKLKADFMDRADYQIAHQNLPMICHDVFIRYQGGILMVIRRNHPAKDILWPIGGRILRGVPMLESLKQKVMDECGLEISNITELGTARTLFDTDPFGHGHGTDTINMIFIADGSGELKLNPDHERPLILTETKYTEDFRNTLHPYVRDNLDQIIKKP